MSIEPGPQADILKLVAENIVYDLYQAPRSFLAWQEESGVEHIPQQHLDIWHKPFLFQGPGLWHVAKRSDRNQILARGLLRPETINSAGLRGVYLSDTPEDWTELHGGQEVDIWAVRTEGLLLHHDPEMGMDGSVIFLGNIGPDRLRLISG